MKEELKAWALFSEEGGFVYETWWREKAPERPALFSTRATAAGAQRRKSSLGKMKAKPVRVKVTVETI